MYYFLMILRLLLILLLCERSSSGFLPLYSLIYLEKDDQIKSTFEDSNLHFMELAKKYGTSAEEYQVVTEDGYILTIHHIPGSGCPVFLQHGVVDSDDTFIIRGNNSLAMTLSRAGYDVWLGNSRGNKYSRNHRFLNPDIHKQYWNFSMHEIGYYDLPAMIDFILEKTYQSKLVAIGHSQGNAIFYVLGAMKPEYNEKIKVMIALAPICFLNNLKAPLNSMAELAPALNTLLKTLDQEELLNDNTALRRLFTILCSMLPFRYELCAEGGFFLLGGSDPEEFERNFLDIVVSHYPTGTSRSNLFHLAQIAKARRFQQFDHGTEKNLQVYGSEIPSEYNLSKVTMRVELFVGINDKVATVEDVNILKEKLPNNRVTLVNHKKMNHLDFVWGKHMDQYLFPPIMSILEEHCKEKLPFVEGNIRIEPLETTKDEEMER